MIAEIIRDNNYTGRQLLKGGHEAIIKRKNGCLLTIEAPYHGAYGMGERFDFLNQKGHTVVNEVIEKFCNQGSYTYCTTPFFMTDTGFGIYVETQEKTVFSFQETIRCEIPENAAVYVFTGSLREILSDYIDLSGRPRLLPEYAFGIWISANRWKSQKDVEQQLALLKEHRFPASVLVLEAWSDEATFYIWNGAKYRVTEGAPKYEDFDFSKSPYWDDPKDMIQKLHEAGLRLVLWQIPVWKKPEPEICSPQLTADRAYAIGHDLCVQNQDGSPYEIPEGNWFSGSMIPDFTKDETKSFWFGKRQYLLDLGVDGFKTDGGEFIYKEDVRFADGKTGRQGKNQYCQDYLDAYTEFLGENHVLFSRAGYTGAHKTPIHWAGDHQSTNEEFKNIVTAGLSAAMSGISYWSFDIGGFAGPLPDPDLYLRSTQMACFCPVMQWHSEPDGGQFQELMPGHEGNNERSPWNIANYYGDSELVDEIRYWHELRMELFPYIYETAKKVISENKPMMRPLIYDFQDDPDCLYTEDQYLFGDKMLVAPLLEKGQKTRKVYLPAGNWFGFFSGKKYTGKSFHESDEAEKCPVYVKEGSVILRKKEETCKGYLYGEKGQDTIFYKQNQYKVVWEQKCVRMEGGKCEEISWEFID